MGLYAKENAPLPKNRKQLSRHHCIGDESNAFLSRPGFGSGFSA